MKTVAFDFEAGDTAIIRSYSGKGSWKAFFPKYNRFNYLHRKHTKFRFAQVLAQPIESVEMNRNFKPGDHVIIIKTDSSFYFKAGDRAVLKELKYNGCWNVYFPKYNRFGYLHSSHTVFSLLTPRRVYFMKEANE